MQRLFRHVQLQCALHCLASEPLHQEFRCGAATEVHDQQTCHPSGMHCVDVLQVLVLSAQEVLLSSFVLNTCFPPRNHINDTLWPLGGWACETESIRQRPAPARPGSCHQLLKSSRASMDNHTTKSKSRNQQETTTTCTRLGFPLGNSAPLCPYFELSRTCTYDNSRRSRPRAL